MLHIVSDSSTLYSPEEARRAGFHCVPLSVCINGSTFRDYEQITPKEMADCCRRQAAVSSSQPAVGEKADLYARLLTDPGDEILDITIADGLSGTFATACMARDLTKDPARITVFNSRALGGPQRLMVETAVRLRDEGKTVSEILPVLSAMAQTDVSMVAVPDLGFLARGGRIPKGMAAAGSLLKLLPVVIRRRDGKALDTLGVSRTWKGVFQKARAAFEQEGGLDASSILYILHGDCPGTAEKARDWFRTQYPDIEIVVLDLCTIFMVHGGPGCLALETVKKL